jgi:hypothetical protein
MYEQARAHAGLGHTHLATGHHDHALHHWRQALTLYADLGLPEAHDMHAHLAALDQSGSVGLSRERCFRPDTPDVVPAGWAL